METCVRNCILHVALNVSFVTETDVNGDFFFSFRVLVAKQAKLDATLPNLSSALHLAVHNGSVPIVQTLLEKELDPNRAGPKAQTPLHLAAQCNRSDLVGLLLKAGAQVLVEAVGDWCPFCRYLQYVCDH